MNVIVSNVNASKFNNLDIDVIKSISGEFTVDEIIQSFSNFFFNRMFLDITAVQGYKDVSVFKKLSVGLDVSKVILLLNDDATVNSDAFISSLISMGIYNFARTEDELRYLYDNPNSYRDVAHLQLINKNVENSSSASSVSAPVDTSVVSDTGTDNNFNSGARVIGFKNFTLHSGATSLIYMLKKQLSNNYYVVAIEVGKDDFRYYNDKDMISCNEMELDGYISQHSDANVILVDLNATDESVFSSICPDVIYLMESSTFKLNKVVIDDYKCFQKMSNKKILLNQCLMNRPDVDKLQQEAGISFFGVLPPLDDRADNSSVLFPLLEKLGLYRKV